MNEDKYMKTSKIIKSPGLILGYLSVHGLLNWMSDETFLKYYFKARTGCKLNLTEPKTFSDKLNWLKINDRNNQYTIMADKYLMKQFVTDKIGQGYVVPLIGVWDSPEDIDYSKLPEKFVLKCNHNSGLGMYICNDKSKINVTEINRQLGKGLKQNFYLSGREWPYKNIKRKIICEAFLQEKNEKYLKDYKFFCFNGEPRCMYIANDYVENTNTDFYDMDFRKMDLYLEDFPSSKVIDKPIFFDEMKRIAKKLSENTKFLRVDFYYVDGQIYVGEMTFFHMSGFVNTNSIYNDHKLGDWIDLSK